jgi:hypothetical protein
MISKVKKNAPIPTKIDVNVVTTRTIERRIIAVTIVPIIAARKHLVCEQRHLDNAEFPSSVEEINKPVINTINAKMAIPKAIQTAIKMFGISDAENTTPIIAPTMALIIRPMQPQAVSLHLLLQPIFSHSFYSIQSE